MWRLSTKKVNTLILPTTGTYPLLVFFVKHMVVSSITKHLSKLNIFYELQHGFREKRSCESQLLMLGDDLFKSVYKKKQTDLILLDFSKAFDKVSHEKLAFKLHDYDLRGPALKWVKGFLDNRHQYVIVNGSSSEFNLYLSHLEYLRGLC